MNKSFLDLRRVVLIALAASFLALGLLSTPIASANNGKGPPCAQDGATTLDLIFGVARMSEHLPGALTNGKSGLGNANGTVAAPHKNCI